MLRKWLNSLDAALNALFGRSTSRRAGLDILAQMSDRRYAPRYPVHEVTRLYVQQRPVTTVIADISESGARFVTRMPRDVGALVGLELPDRGQTMTLPMRVIWDRWGGAHFENGAYFLDLDPSQRTYLLSYLGHVGTVDCEWGDEIVVPRSLEDHLR